MILRDYQKEAIDALWNKISVSQTALCVLSTGAGKSVIFENFIEKCIKAKPDIKILVLFNKTDLLDQIQKRIANLIGKDKVGLYIGSFKKYDASKTVTCGMIQSLRPSNINYNLIIVDECHNLNQKKGRYIKFLNYQMEQNPKTRVIGFTATPFRESGYIFGPGKFFDSITYHKTMQFMIDNKYLVPPIAKQPDHLIDVSKFRIKLGEYDQDDVDKAVSDKSLSQKQVKDALQRCLGRKKIVWFCANITHAETIHWILRHEGEDAVTLHSQLSNEQRTAAKEEFENGSARHMTFVTIVSEGYDYPPIDCVVLLRPTRSPNLMVQTCGRGLRLFPEKEDCLILDYANVISTLGPLDDPVIQENGAGKKKGKEDSRVKFCKKCRRENKIAAHFCVECGTKFVSDIPENLDEKAKENIDFFAKQKKIMAIDNIYLRKHISKNGNNCIAVEYSPGLFSMNASIHEYFVFDAQYGYVRFQKRAIELGIPLAGTLDEQVTKKPLRVPKEVEYEFEGKYPKIKRLIFGEKELQ